MKRPPLEVQPQHRALPPTQPIETQVQAAVAEAIAHEPAPVYADDDGVTVEPYIPAALHAAYDDHVRIDDAPVPTAYVPSHAARPDGQRRMPRTEELPAVARRSLDAPERREEEPRNARALFKRLASNVGIGLRAPQHPGLDETQYSTAEDAAARTAIEAGAARNSGTSASHEGARGLLDQHGRQLPVKDHIEIPSFLRKHG